VDLKEDAKKEWLSNASYVARVFSGTKHGLNRKVYFAAQKYVKKHFGNAMPIGLLKML
jgi:hypothetical protein